MFDIGFSEVLLIFVIALVVLGPEKLPRVASQVGRWIGRARSMARQFREQLEEEVNLEQVRKAHQQKPKPEADGGPGTSAESSGGTGAAAAGAAAGSTSAATPGSDAGTDTSSASAATYRGPDPADFRADTFSHAHPTNEYGANPYTASGAAEDPPVDTHATTSPESPAGGATAEPGTPAQSQFPFEGQTPSEANLAAAQPQSESNAEGHGASGEAYAARRPRDNTPGTDNHGN